MNIDFPESRSVRGACPHNCDMHWTSQVVCSLFGPHMKISVDNQKGNYTFSKDICKNFSNIFTNHNSSIDEVYWFRVLLGI